MNDEIVDRCVRQQRDELDQLESERVKCDLHGHAGGATTIDKGCAASYSLMKCVTQGVKYSIRTNQPRCKRMIQITTTK